MKSSFQGALRYLKLFMDFIQYVPFKKFSSLFKFYSISNIVVFRSLHAVIYKSTFFGYKATKANEPPFIELPLNECQLIENPEEGANHMKDQMKDMYCFKLCHLNANSLVLGTPVQKTYNQWIDTLRDLIKSDDRISPVQPVIRDLKQNSNSSSMIDLSKHNVQSHPKIALPRRTSSIRNILKTGKRNLRSESLNAISKQNQTEQSSVNVQKFLKPVPQPISVSRALLLKSPRLQRKNSVLRKPSDSLPAPQPCASFHCSEGNTSLSLPITVLTTTDVTPTSDSLTKPPLETGDKINSDADGLVLPFTSYSEHDNKDGSKESSLVTEISNRIMPPRLSVPKLEEPEIKGDMRNDVKSPGHQGTHFTDKMCSRTSPDQESVSSTESDSYNNTSIDEADFTFITSE